jgi:hypothetical protein
MKRANKLAMIKVRNYGARPNITDKELDHLFIQATAVQGPPTILERMDRCGFIADWDAADRWYWRRTHGRNPSDAYEDFPTMLRKWEELVWPTLAPKERAMLPANILALLQIRGYEFAIEGTQTTVACKGVVTRHDGIYADVVEEYWADQTEQVPQAFLEMDAAGVHLRRDDEGRWQWKGGGYTSVWFDTADMAMDNWYNMPRAGKPAQPPQPETDVRIAALQHYIEDGHRSAARDELPAHISVAPDAKVEISYGRDGRVLGCHVDARIFVSLAPAQK